MLIYDDSFVAAMTATRQEATRLGADVYGSEHALLGLLAADGSVSQDVVRRYPQLTPDAVRTAIEQALDDLPHLRRLGIEPSTVQPATDSAGSTQNPAPRNRHAPELQTALNSATSKWSQLRKTHPVPHERKLSSTVLWLAVLEPSARASRLLQALDADPHQVRSVVLAAMVPAGQMAPVWPAQAALGPVQRLMQRFFTRVNVAN